MNHSGKKRLMLVEDEFVTAKITTRILNTFGYEVVSINSGEKAVDFNFEENNIDLVLMDIDLGPGIDGTETATQILTKVNLPIVFLTSHSEKEMVDKVKNITRYGYVIKDSGDFVLQSSIEMAFNLFEAHQQLEIQMGVLKESRERLDFALSAVNESIWDYLPDRNYLFWNPNFYAILGYEPNQFPASIENWKKLLHPYDQELTISMFQDCINGLRDDYNHECRMLTQKGSYKWVHIKGKVLNKNQQGQVTRIIGTLADISDRKTIEEKEQQTFRMLEDIIASIPSGLFIYQFEEPDFLYLLQANDEAAHLTGLDFSVWIGKEFNEIWPNSKELGITDTYLKVVYSGENVELTDTYYSDDKLTGFFRIKAFNIPGRKLGIAFENITKIREAELELYKSQQLFQQFLEHSPAYVFFKDETGRAIYLSRNFENMLGRPLDQILNRDMRELFPPELAEKMINDDSTILHGGVEVELDEVMGDRYYKTIKYPIFLKDKPTYLAGFTIDVTSQKKLELELIESKEYYRRLVEIIPEGILIHQQGIMIYVNQKAADIVGYNHADELIGRSIFDFLTPDYHSFSKKRIEDTLIDGEAKRPAEEELFHKDGHRIVVEVSSVAFKYQGKDSILTVFKDISDRKKNEDEIHSLLAEKELLLKEVHHRVKNNMYIISSLLAMQADSMNDPTIVNALNDARNRVVTLMVIYEKLFRSDNYSSLSIQSYLDELINMIFTTFPNSESIHLNLDIEDFTQDSKKSFLIGIIVNELITNSLKHAFNNIDNPEISIRIFKDEQLVHLIFQDNGSGLDEEIMKNKGKGFGLNLVDLIIEQLEGKLLISSLNGTEFYLTFE